MNIIKSNISQMWYSKHSFFIVVILVQAIAAFSVLYVTGAIANDYFSLKENADTNLTLYVSFDKALEDNNPVYYPEVKETLFDICNNNIPGAVDYIGISTPYADDFTLTTAIFGIDGDNYCLTDVVLKNIGGLIIDGRIFTEEELNNEGYYAIVGGYDSDKLVINEQNFDIVGKHYSIPKHPEITTTPYAFESLEMEIRSVAFFLNRIITDTEFAKLEILFEKAVQGRFDIWTMTSTSEDKKAILRSSLVTSCLIGLSALTVLLIVYSYIINLRKKNLAIWRLTGCTAIKAAVLFFTEMAIISAPSVLLGFIAFYFTQKAWLNELYPYMTVTHTLRLYVGFYIVIMLALFVLFAGISIVHSRHSIKQQLIRADI